MLFVALAALAFVLLTVGSDICMGMRKITSVYRAKPKKKKPMKVVLQEPFRYRGKMRKAGRKLKVKSGFWRNVLLPQGIAQKADRVDPRMAKQLKLEKKIKKAQEVAKVKDAEDAVAKIESMSPFIIER